MKLKEKNLECIIFIKKNEIKKGKIKKLEKRVLHYSYKL